MKMELQTGQQDLSWLYSAIKSDLSNASLGRTAVEGELSEKTHMTTTAMKLTVPCEFMALPTIPVYLTNE